MKKIKPAIKEIFKDDDGWWLVLKNGWSIDDSITCREDTRKKLMARLKDAKLTGLT